MSTKTQKTCFVSIVGAPNAGKSTLTNHIVGSKVSIVTPKVQTTRTRVTGIAMHNDTQIVLVDTPGIFKPTKTLDKAMVRAAWGGLRDSDIVVMLVDASRYKNLKNIEEIDHIINGVAQREGHAILVLNKVDKTNKESLLALASYCFERHQFDSSFMISALTGDGVSDLVNYLDEQAHEMDWPFDPEQVSTVASKIFATEITREKLMFRLQHELPYDLVVTTETWEEKPASEREPNGSIKIRQVIYVNRDNQKTIIIGKGGGQLKQIGQEARKELEKLFGCKVHLFLFVKVDPNWQNKREIYHEIGLD